MANVSIPILDASGATRNIDGYSLPNGDVQQATVIGDGTNDGRTMAIEAGGDVRTVTNKATTSTLTSVTASATSQTIVAANANRRGAVIFNAGSTVLFLRYGTVAATTAAGGYSVQVPVNGAYFLDMTLWAGAMTGIWAGTPTGAATVTDLSA